MSNPPIPPNVAEIAAPMLLGALWNWTLYGVLVVQIYVYSYNFPGDRTLVQVTGQHSLERTSTIGSSPASAIWTTSLLPTSLPSTCPLLDPVVTLIVQLFFVYRIWVLSSRSSWFLCLLIYLFSIVAAGAAFYGGIYTHVRDQFASGRMLKVLALTWMSGNASADILIRRLIAFLPGTTTQRRMWPFQ
ncbi:hypothetical protein EDB83DRAFT_678017 [Lactarius deliciosus]|nr:hypothetical protein EDB83DRAFT_678017 [Lactarius deliciosus]